MFTSSVPESDFLMFFTFYISFANWLWRRFLNSCSTACFSTLSSLEISIRTSCLQFLLLYLLVLESHRLTLSCSHSVSPKKTDGYDVNKARRHWVLTLECRTSRTGPYTLVDRLLFDCHLHTKSTTSIYRVDRKRRLGEDAPWYFSGIFRNSFICAHFPIQPQ